MFQQLKRLNTMKTLINKSELLNRKTIYVIDESNDMYCKISAFRPENVEDLRESNTYDKFGIKCKASDCGDWIEVESNNEEAINKLINKYNNEENEDEYLVMEEQIIFAHERVALFEFLTEKGIESKGTKIKGINYWDDKKWRTAVIEHPYSEIESKLIDDKEILDYLDTLYQYQIANLRIHWSGSNLLGKVKA